jgi:hypothetical protein
MRTAISATLGAVAMACVSTSVLAQTAGVGPPRVAPQPTPEYARAYAICYELALRRGQNVSRGDDVSRASFVDQCLAGKIPLDPPSRR